MSTPFDAMDGQALENHYARTSYLLRESRKEILKRHAVPDEAALLGLVRSGKAAAHPAYEHYLSALVLDQMRAQVQAEMLALNGGSIAALPAISLHLVLMQELERDYGDRMSEAPRLALDALTLAFDTGLLMELRCFDANAYSLGWSFGEHELRIDTAPHPDAPAGAAHLHRDGAWQRLPAGLMPAGAALPHSFSGLLDVLLHDPLLEKEPPAPGTFDPQLQFSKQKEES